MLTVPADLQATLTQHGQEHVFVGWDTLRDDARAELVRTLRSFDFAELRRLHARRDEKADLPDRSRVASLPRMTPSTTNAALAETAWRAGAVAYLVVAGGQGSRLGFDAPKGCLPIGPVSQRTLFQVHAEKVLALGRRYGRPLPLLVMTSPATDAATREFFARAGRFGLRVEDVTFFCQGLMPALDLATGRLLLTAPGKLALSPNGHGGTLTGLADSGLLDTLRQRGVRTLYYFQVDNPLVDLADQDFLGQHLGRRAEVSTKVIAKRDPHEKVGNVVLVDGRCTILEYSDLPRSWAEERDEQGQLLLWAGNPAIHLFDLDFLERMTAEPGRLPWHLARKKVAALDDAGRLVAPTTENALKFERFIFDVLPQAERWAVWETTRAEEFAPVKNADGLDSPATARQALSDQAADWLARAGVEVRPEVPVEISPLFALDPGELAAKVRGLPPIERATVFQE